MENEETEKANIITKVKDVLGSYSAIARICQVSAVAVFGWKRRGGFPRTDYTGETRYAETIYRAMNGLIPMEQLLPRD